MAETSISHGQGRAEWPTSRRTRRRRESKVAYRNNPPYSSQSAGPSTYTSQPDQPYSRNNGQVYLQQSQEQVQNLGFLDFFDIGHPSIGNQGLSPIVHQDGPVDASWFSLSSTSYTLASNPPNSPHGFGSNNALSVNTGFSPTPNYAQDIPWNGATPRTNSIGSEIDDLSMLDFESFGGTFDSMLMSTPSTAASSMSEGYVFPMTNSGFGASEASQLDGLALSDEYYQVGPTFDPSSPGWVNPSSPTYQEHFHFENDGSPVTQNWTSRDVYTTEAAELSSITLIVPQQQTPEPQATDIPMLSQTPWNSQTAQISEYQSNASPGINTFEPPPGAPYYTHIARQEFLDTGQPKPRVFGPEPVSPAGESESDGWLVPSYPSSYAASHSSPNSHDSPASRASSPPQHEVEHQHIFTSIPGVRKTKVLRGRQRGLTALEKKQARDVRECRSCWACHISKTKCSPCSPGKPCEQCARLAGKRRFCLFSCFNDPLETLSTFLIPDYLTSHLTKANVESFVSRNASSWGTEYLFVRMSWGYKRRLLDAEVVALTLVNNNSEMGYQELAVANGNARPLLVRKASPPLGIPLAAMDDMQDKYASYIQDIVQSDLAQYVPVAYTDQDSLLPQRLLGAVCAFYTAGSETDNESPILRRAIEIHVTAVILERNLGLDPESLNKVQNYLQEEYPPRSAPRCAQRQVKLAFFMLQQKRIMRVLKEWGNMMWTIKDPASKDKEWAIAFSVFLMLTLVIDKTLGAAYYFCEARIAHSGYEAGPERARFQELVRLTEKELFDRCKEIFHWKLKTRKGGKEACNPIRDGVNAFKGKSSDSSITRLVTDLQAVVSDYEPEVRSHRSSRRDSGMEYTDAGRLACVFLDDFLNH